jgi:2,4'-dihydroxyacetophenone dioxygenase
VGPAVARRHLPAPALQRQPGLLRECPAGPRSGILSRHRHTGPVHAITIRGGWHYLEHDWWAEEGTYSFELPGDIHTLEVPDGVAEMRTLFHVTRRHFEAVGLGADSVERFIR